MTHEDDFSNGRCAVVTGAASGIGKGIATTLVRHGYATVFLDLDRGRAEEAALEASTEAPNGPRALGLAADVSSADDVAAVTSEIVERMGPPTVLVNNAGIIADPRPIEDSDEVTWDRILAVNLKSQFLLCRAIVPFMKDAGFGRVVNIASRSWLGVGGRTNYSASKGAVISFTRSLAIEVGEFGITVNCVSPTLVRTPLFEATPKEDQDQALARAALQPIKRLGTVEDVATAVRFFVSDDASFITGQHLYVGGGVDLLAGSP